MQNLLKLSSLFVLMIILTGCPDDPVDPTLSPSVSFVTETDFLDADANVANGGDVFKVKLSAVSGTAALKTLTVFEDGTKLSTDRFDVNGDPAAANPLLVLGDDTNSFTWTVSVTAHDAGTVNYEFVVEDEGGLSDAASLNITIGAVGGEVPKLTFEGDGMFMTSPGSLVSIAINAEVGSSPLSSIAVYEGGVLIPDADAPDRLKIDDAATSFVSNPQPLAEGSKEGFATNLFIRSHETSGAITYTVEITDEAANTASFDVTISSGTPVTETVAILVSNADGPNQGGLDLDGGTSVPSASTDAELRDLGIDLNQNPANNWIQKVEPVNGAELRIPDASQPEGFKYENITSTEAIQAAFDAGTSVTLSDKLEVGDVILVSSNGNTWILQVAVVNVTEADNTDSYEFNVKG